MYISSFWKWPLTRHTAEFLHETNLSNTKKLIIVMENHFDFEICQPEVCSVFVHLSWWWAAHRLIYQTGKQRQLRPITHSCQSSDCGCSPQGWRTQKWRQSQPPRSGTWQTSSPTPLDCRALWSRTNEDLMYTQFQNIWACSLYCNYSLIWFFGFHLL